MGSKPFRVISNIVPLFNSRSFQSAKLVTTEAEALASCAPEMRSNQHQVTLLTAQLIQRVMAPLRCQMRIIQLVVSILIFFSTNNY